MDVLQGEDAPDVIEVGNTQVAKYAQSGGLSDLTLTSMRDLGSEVAAGPRAAREHRRRPVRNSWYAANRIVIYNKELFAQAGITTPPKTREEWIEDTEKLNSSGSQGIYLAGQNWYVLAGFIWDEGGDLAERNGGEWEGPSARPPRSGNGFLQGTPGLGGGPKNADEEKPRSPRSSRGVMLPRSSMCREVPPSLSSRTPNSRESSATSPFRARPRRRPAPYSPAARI
ncbi:extracellular solute-binding protein [Streptomyces sp. M10(2022)]